MMATLCHFDIDPKNNRYDFDVEGNGEFRLFASGNNHYREGAEVLNSYGRRPNENLLLEYGFAMLDNEWDEVELPCALSSWESFFDRKMTVLHNSGQYTSRSASPHGPATANKNDFADPPRIPFFHRSAPPRR